MKSDVNANEARSQ